jgi:hypothetical protein
MACLGGDEVSSGFWSSSKEGGSKKMSKVEPWRRKELAVLLDEMVSVLRSGKNPEWAGVFAHFGQELALLSSAQAADERALERLIGCIELCLAPGGGFSRLVLEGPEQQETPIPNDRLGRLRAELTQVLVEIRRRLVEFVN